MHSTYNNLIDQVATDGCRGVPDDGALNKLSWDELDTELKLTEATDGLHYVLIHYLWKRWQDGLVDTRAFRFELTAARLSMHFSEVFVDMLSADDCITSNSFIEISSVRLSHDLRSELMKVSPLSAIIHTIGEEFARRNYRVKLCKLGHVDAIAWIYPENTSDADYYDILPTCPSEMIAPFFTS